MSYIQPEGRHQITLFKTLDSHIERDNPVRILDLLVDQIVESNPKQFKRGKTTRMGRPSYLPQTLLKLYLYGYFNGVSSSRKLEKETKRNIEVIWLLGRLSPDHKTIADYRKEHSEAIEFMTSRFRDYLVGNKHISGREVTLDGSKFKANASKARFLETKRLTQKIASLETRLDQYLEQLKRNDVLEDLEEDGAPGEGVNQALLDKVCELEEEVQKLKAEKGSMEARGVDRENTTDPDCRLMKSKEGYIPGYNIQSVNDTDSGMIILSEVRQEPGDHGLTKEIMEHLEDEASIIPKELLADKAYYSSGQLKELEEEKDITSWIPAPEPAQNKTDREAGISFEHQLESDTYQCSEGKTLYRVGVDKDKNAIRYQGKECGSCLLKAQCTKGKNRTIKIPIEKDWIDQYKKRVTSRAGKNAVRRRGAWAEHPFGTIKQWMGKIPLKMRGKKHVQTEINLYTLVYNFKRLIRIESMDGIERSIARFNWEGTKG